MSKVISIALKDMKLRFGSKAELLFFLILPLVFTLILSGVLFSDEAGKIVMVMVDEDNSELSRKMVNLLQSSETVAPSLLARENAQETFDKREAAAIMIIPSGMEASLKAGQAVALDFTLDPSNLNGLAAQQEVQKAIDQISRGLVVASISTREAEQIQPFTEAAQRQTYYDQSLTAAQQEFDSAPTRIVITQPENTAEIETQLGNQAAQASAGQLIIWVFIPLLGTSQLMAYERVQGHTAPPGDYAHPKADLPDRNDHRPVQLRPYSNAHVGVDRSRAAQGALGPEPAGAAGAAGQLRPGIGGDGHHDGHLHTDFQPGQRLEHRPRDGAGAAGRLHVSTRVIPTSGSHCGENPAHHLGHDGHDPADCLQRRPDSDPALCRRPVRVLGGVLRGGSLEVPLRVETANQITSPL